MSYYERIAETRDNSKYSTIAASIERQGHYWSHTTSPSSVWHSSTGFLGLLDFAAVVVRSGLFFLSLSFSLVEATKERRGTWHIAPHFPDLDIMDHDDTDCWATFSTSSICTRESECSRLFILFLTVYGESKQ